MFAPATLWEYLGLPIDFGERVDLGGATSAGMVWRAAAAVELGLCDAVLAVVPGSTELPQSERGPVGPSAGTARRATSSAPRRPSSRSRTATSARTALRPDRPALRGRIRLRRSRVGQDRRPPAHQRVRPSRRGVPRQADHHRRRAGQPDDRRPDPHARDRDARAGRRGRADRQRRPRAPRPPSSGVDQGLRRAHRVQDADLRRRSDAHTRSRAPPNGPSRWRAWSGPTSTWRRSTTATRSPC